MYYMQDDVHAHTNTLQHVHVSLFNSDKMEKRFNYQKAERVPVYR